VALAAAPSGAFGHATVLPGASRPADVQVYRVTVPNEADTDTTEVRLRIPAGLDFVLADVPPQGWSADLVRSGDRLREIRWHGGRIAPGFYGTFRFLARNPVEEGDVRWPIVQRYANGDVVRWIGPEDSGEPASVTAIRESAVPVDTVSVHAGDATPGAPAAAPGAAGAPAAAATTKDDGPLALILAGVALAASLAGLAIAASGRRGKAS
jgi:uncharacterized protein YcnI